MTRILTTGGAVRTTLTASLNNSATAFTVVSVTGWPTSVPFVIVIDRGTSSEEKILVTARSGTSITNCTRGYDGTVATSHNVGTNNVEHAISAIQIDEANAHTNDTARDDHTQYTKGSLLTTRGDIFVRGAAAVQRLAIGAANRVLRSDGTDPSWGQVQTGDIANSAITSALIADGNVTPAKLAATAFGTYTPAISQSAADTPLAPSSAGGRYLQIGKLVFAWGTVISPVAGTPGQPIKITLPVNAFTGGDNRGLGNCRFTFQTLDPPNYIGEALVTSATKMSFRTHLGVGFLGVDPAVTVNNSGSYAFSIVYEAA